MRKPCGIIALDLDGTLLNSAKSLSEGNLVALHRAAEAGFLIVPTTGRFYGGMPEVIRNLPFVRYVITINGAEVADLQTGQVIYSAQIPKNQAVEILAFLDSYPLIYDCYMDNRAFMTASQKERLEEMISSSHYRKMVRELREPVAELKAFLLQQAHDVQKIQFFTNQPALRLELMQTLPKMFTELCVSSSVADNVEINHICANKGDALLALADHLQIPHAHTIAFGDGLNDLSMLRMAGIGIAMANGEPAVKEAADHITASCDDDGVALGIKKFLFENQHFEQ